MVVYKMDEFLLKNKMIRRTNSQVEDEAETTADLQNVVGEVVADAGLPELIFRQLKWRSSCLTTCESLRKS